MLDEYDIGDVTRLSVSFNDLSNVFVDPSSVMIKVRDPDAVIIQLSYPTNDAIIKDSVGNYHMDYLISKDGLHNYKWVGSGTVYASEKASFFVRPDTF